MQYRTLSPRGFTLLEVLVYIALFSLIMSSAFGAAYALVESSARQAGALQVQQEGAFINSKLNSELANAQNVANIASASMRIEPSDVVFAQTGDTMTISRNGGAAIALSGNAHKVADVQFTIVPAASAKPASVRVTYKIDGTQFTFATYLRQ